MNCNIEGEQKSCTKCGKIKALSDFGVDKRRPTGRKSQCKQCAREYRNANKKRLNNYAKDYYRDKKETILQQKKEYYLENKEKIIEREKEYRLKNQESIRAYRRRYKKENRDLFNHYKQKRRSLKRKLPSSLTTKQWIDIKNSFGNSCAYCGNKETLHQEHFIPLSKGGEHTIDNIIPACANCNSSKCDRDFFECYPVHESYSSRREREILRHLNYKNDNLQQLSIL